MSASHRTLGPMCALCLSSTARSARLLMPIRGVRLQSSAAETTASTSTSHNIAPSTSQPSPTEAPTSPKPTKRNVRIVAASLLSRPPRRMSPISSFEKEYYKYARKINRAISTELDSEWYFRKGSQAEQAYKDLLQAAEDGKEDVATPLAVDTSIDEDVHNMERKADRTLYFLAKKDRTTHAWQFPQGGVEAKESLADASSRELTEEFGQDLDVWHTGRLPAAHHSYTPDSTSAASKTQAEHTSSPLPTKVFFMPARVMRGSPQPNKQEGIVDYAWCTKEEVRERVAEDYYTSVENVLSH